MSPVKITQVRPADENNQVLTVEGGNGSYRRSPCTGCPWIKDNDGSFPAEAFRHSAHTSEDMSGTTFGCHESGTVKPATCAGFLLRGAGNNKAVRLAAMVGTYKGDVSDDGFDLHENYRAMAEANGVDPGDSALARSRD